MWFDDFRRVCPIHFQGRFQINSSMKIVYPLPQKANGIRPMEIEYLV